jgi:ketosteroid isomerase-like protein
MCSSGLTNTRLDIHCQAKCNKLIKIKEGIMKKPILVVSLVLLLCLIFACQKQGKEVAKAPDANMEADVAALKALNDELVQLYNAEDFDRIMSVYYVENPIQMAPNVPVRRGKEAILLAYQEDSRLNIQHIGSSSIEDVRISGKLAVAWGMDTGTTTPRSGGDPVPYSLKWLNVFERQLDGTWRCLYEMWNDNNPLPETPKK